MNEENRCADFLAHMAFYINHEVSVLEGSPDDLAPYLIQNINGYSCDRYV